MARAPSPPRSLGFWSATALVIASMLGTGVFATSGFLLADLHSPSLVMTGPRVYAKMAADGYLPRSLAACGGPPRIATLFQLALALGLLWTASYQSLLTFIGFTLNLSTVAIVTGLIRERRRVGPSLPVPGWPWIPCAFVAAVLGMTLLSIARAPVPSLLGCGVLAGAWVLWRAIGTPAPASHHRPD